MYEQELKLTAANAEVLIAALNSDTIQRYSLAPAPQPQRFLAKYYDTKNRTLENDQCSLRARREGRKFRAAFKLPGHITDGMSQRQEYECDIDGWLKNAGKLPDGDLKSLVLNHIEETEKLFAMVTVDMQRQIVNLEVNGTKIEMVADQGTITGNGREVEICEIELELKSGEINIVKEIGDELKAKYELNPSRLTKHQIGLELCNSR
ncbi:CYTH domain-containing protein [Candidatus Spongiihabitans sp.]|uniref:CYTH domain-containing protein n=1 Tax=Candidatus Spongiihabitans sp. TaxID=3101308 RepID=UPI003C7DB88C